MTDPEAVEPNAWLTPREEAELLGVTARSVRCWIYSDRLPASRTHFRVRAEDLDLVPGREPPRPTPGPGTRSSISASIIGRIIRND